MKDDGFAVRPASGPIGHRAWEFSDGGEVVSREGGRFWSRGELALVKKGIFQGFREGDGDFVAACGVVRLQEFEFFGDGVGVVGVGGLGHGMVLAVDGVDEEPS